MLTCPPLIYGSAHRSLLHLQCVCLRVSYTHPWHGPLISGDRKSAPIATNQSSEASRWFLTSGHLRPRQGTISPKGLTTSFCKYRNANRFCLAVMGFWVPMTLNKSSHPKVHPNFAQCLGRPILGNAFSGHIALSDS